MTESRADTIRNVLGIVQDVVGNRQVAPVAPVKPKEKTDYTPFIIAGVFTIVSALIISGRK
jgi:hypothetical protein